MPSPVHLRTASDRTHHRMTSSCRPASLSDRPHSASAAFMSADIEQTHPVGCCSTSTPTCWLATAISTASPLCAREKCTPKRSGRAGRPVGFPHRAHGSRWKTRLDGGKSR